MQIRSLIKNLEKIKPFENTRVDLVSYILMEIESKPQNISYLQIKKLEMDRFLSF